MTAQEFIKGCEHDGSYIPVGEVLRLMEEWAKLMCDKQKEICADNAEIEDYCDYVYGDLCTFQRVNSDSILKAPYPDELQGNN